MENFKIPKNTTVFFGLGSAHHDNKVWKNPETFNPNRFLDENMTLINTEKIFPFGLGNRRCLGEQLAKESVYTFFVGILNEFTLLPTGNDADKPSLNLLPGIFISPRPYKIVFRSNNKVSN